MSFLAGLASLSTQHLTKRSLASSSWRTSLPVVTNTVVGAVKVRRNGTQTPEYQPPNMKMWLEIKSAMDKAMHHRRDATPDQAWERRSASKTAKLQQAPLPGPSTGKLARTIARLFYFLWQTFLFTITCFFRSYGLHFARPVVCWRVKQTRPNPPNKPCTARAYGGQVLHQRPCAETQAQCHSLETTVCTNGRSKKPSS